ncbi:MAG: histidine kinase, partial [Muribaculaceae bacterium]|nr:histidine kinase [Muribaculaceae bacterium]
VLAATLSYAMRLSEARELMRRRELEMSAEQRQLELKSLKAQLNPHFLFNSLNNIYALIGFAPERAQKALHDLSNMLRFMIYESGSSTVALAKEIQFIVDYTALMSLRLNSNIRVECKVMEFPPSDVMVTPLIFLTLVENAFKHVAPLPDGTGFIRIELNIKDEKLYATLANSYSEKNGNSPSGQSDSGIGLENVKRQLRLLYPDRHTFTITNKEGVFTASISIPLSALSPQT